MRMALEELGYNPNNHRSQGVSEELLAWADKIVIMGNAHEKFITEHYPQYLTKITNWNVKDPHFATGNELHRKVAKEIEVKVNQLFVE
jgi:protein-tyrosine-phosphatase